MMILPGLLDHRMVRILVVPEFNPIQIARLPLRATHDHCWLMRWKMILSTGSPL